MNTDFRELERVIQWHFGHHGHLEEGDLVKLLFQAIMGMDHLLRDRQRFARAVEAEWEGLGNPLAGELLLEPVSPRRRIGRLNLRPLKAAGAALVDVAQVLSCQPRIAGSPVELKRVAVWSVDAVRCGKVPGEASQLEELWDSTLMQGHAPRHSAFYRQARVPAYRLVHSPRDERFVRLVSNATTA